MDQHLNTGADRLCQRLPRRAHTLRIERTVTTAGTTLWDFGLETAGGLEAGCLLARVCLAGLGKVGIIDGQPGVWPGPAVSVRTDHCVAACMASQYAGWQLSGDAYFAMGSGPMRAAAGREALFDRIGHLERPDIAVGVCESRRLPPETVCAQIAEACRLPPGRLTLLVAPTASLAGTVQVVARTIETALHKMLELNFDLHQVVSGWGVAPLPPVGRDDRVAIGLTNDAVLYGGRVTLWVRSEDQTLSEIVSAIPSNASPDFGQPFVEIFERYGRDFYQIDPHLFSPAEITLVNIQTGRVFRAGQTRPDILRRSFEG